jgi:hypothetical protein
LLAALLALTLATPAGLLPGTSPAIVSPTPQLATLTAVRHRPAHHRKVAPKIPHLRAWLCIHSHVAPNWTIANAPYYGGLQMDVGFQRTYGAAYFRTKGTANHWTPAQQMLAAEHAWRVRGFSPWPNTARMCGLRS